MAKPYDVEMIRDFIDHLMWEVRISAMETQRDNVKPNPELVDQLKKYVDKRGVVGLLNVNELQDDVGGEFGQRARHILRDKLNAQRKDWLLHMEGLGELFQEALQCAEKPKHLSKVVTMAHTVLEESGIEYGMLSMFPLYELNELQNEEFREQVVRPADLIFGVHPDRVGEGACFFGLERLKQIAAGMQGGGAKGIRFRIDWTEESEHLEMLCAAVTVLKGKDCYSEYLKYCKEMDGD